MVTTRHGRHWPFSRQQPIRLQPIALGGERYASQTTAWSRFHIWTSRDRKLVVIGQGEPNRDRGSGILQPLAGAASQRSDQIRSRIANPSPARLLEMARRSKWPIPRWTQLRHPLGDHVGASDWCRTDALLIKQFERWRVPAKRGARYRRAALTKQLFPLYFEGATVLWSI